MRRVKQKIERMLQRIVDWGMGNGLMQDELTASGNDQVPEEMATMIRRCAAEGCVLLKNNGALPLKKKRPIAVFGRCQIDWFYVGYGSGGDVHPPYCVNLLEGLHNSHVTVDPIVSERYVHWCGAEKNKVDHGWWGHWPTHHPEMPLDTDFVHQASTRCDTALIVIGRAAGEDRESTLTPGSYYLTEAEKSMLNTVTTEFQQTIVLLNIGSVMDLEWIETYAERIDSVLLVWQGGMESGNAVTDVLTGKVNPCGKLTDTIAKKYKDYPSSLHFGGKRFNCYFEDVFVGYRYFETFAKEKILYPFGYGLSYTTFEEELCSVTPNRKEFTARIRIKNTGNCYGRHVSLLWCTAPQGKLGKPQKVLVAYGKSGELQPGQSEILELQFDERCFSSFDDTGVTGYSDAFVLEAGEYRFFLEGDHPISISEEQTRLVQQCESACEVREPFVRLTATYKHGKIRPSQEKLFPGKTDLRQRILDRLPKLIPVTGNQGHRLSDVAEGKITLNEFIAQLNDAELEALTRGEGRMGSELGTAGNAGAFGGILPSLREKGVSPMIVADGPAGIRVKRFCALLPSGTALACTWDDQLVEGLFVHLGKEMIRHKLDVILSPGMNIHRNPMCGRNFEYFSEDPLVTGKMASAVIRGVQKTGVSCCPKHFACNNQETKRSTNDSRVSKRALREIYLRGFEIAVKEGKPNTLMTSYNKVNGVWSHYHYDLVTTILRGEWGYAGMVMTDWWMRRGISREFPKLRDNAYRVRAQVDVLMPGDMGHLCKKYRSDGTLLETLEQPDGITRAELQRTAHNVLRFILETRFKETEAQLRSIDKGD